MTSATPISRASAPPAASRPPEPASPSRTALTTARLIDEAPIGRFQVAVFALCILVSVLDGFDTQSIAFVAPTIAKQWGVSQWHFGFIFSATLLGSVIGSATLGVLADRIGRRRVVIATTALFGLGSAACALAQGYWSLLIFRLIGGIGMGGVIPVMIALSAEYAPQRLRATIVTFTLWGFPFGAVVGGIAAGPLLASQGWRALFWVGAIAPLLLVPVLIALLPESLRFLSLDARRRGQIIALLRRIDPARADEIVIEPHAANEDRGRIASLFAGALAAPTILFCAVLFLALFLSYLLINWVPTLLTQAGMPMTSAILGAVALNLGGIIGSYALSSAVDRRPRPALLLAAGYTIAALVIAVTAMGSTKPVIALALLLACGCFHIGTQLATTAYASAVYPVQLRGTGIGLIQAIGRIGSLIGPVTGGALLSAGWSERQLLLFAAVPALLCGLCMLVLARLRGPEARSA